MGFHASELQNILPSNVARSYKILT